MNQDQEAKESASIPCTQGCGFFGRPETNNMCSKCFKDELGHKGNGASRVLDVLPTVEKVDIKAIESSPEVKPSLARIAEPVEPFETKKVKLEVDRSRCAECKKKVGLTAVECRCGNVYCGSHRIAEKHACTFDYKSFGRESIQKANERVVAESLVDKL